MTKLTKSYILKKNLVDALKSTLGVVTSACEKCECSRVTFYDYYRDDLEFKKEVDSVQDIALDFVESKLYEQIKDKVTAATIFYLKTKGRKRGYIERIEQDIRVDTHDFDKAQEILNKIPKDKTNE